MKYLKGSLVVFVLFILAACTLSGCTTPPTATAAPAAEVVALSDEEVPDQETGSAEASALLVTTESVKVPVVLANVDPKGVLYPILGDNQVMPYRAMGDGTVIVPSGYVCLMTTDPYVLYGESGNELSRGKASVILFGEGSYRVETLVHPSGELKAHTTCSNLVLNVFVMQELNALSLNVGYEAGLVDLRMAAPVSTVETTSVVTAATTTISVTETLPVEVPDTSATTEVPAEVCIGTDSSFAVGYTDSAATEVVFYDPARWIVAGIDANATINGVLNADKVLAVVEPGNEVVVSGLGRDPQGRAYTYACVYTSEPGPEVVSAHFARETDGGQRVVVVVNYPPGQ